jgi:hypothetical protein
MEVHPMDQDLFRDLTKQGSSARKRVYDKVFARKPELREPYRSQGSVKDLLSCYVANGMGPKPIGDRLGVSEFMVKRWIDDLGIKFTPGPKKMWWKFTPWVMAGASVTGATL